jgi:hypothetical protein
MMYRASFARIAEMVIFVVVLSMRTFMTSYTSNFKTDLFTNSLGKESRFFNMMTAAFMMPFHFHYHLLNFFRFVIMYVEFVEF